MSNIDISDQTGETVVQAVAKDNRDDTLPKPPPDKSSDPGSPGNQSPPDDQIASSQAPVIAMLNGAWSELCNRIQARQNVQTAFSTGVLILMGGLITLMQRQAQQTGPDKQVDYALALFSLLLPVLGVIFSSWTAHQDMMIGMLGKFCCHCEDSLNIPKPLRWHTPGGDWNPACRRIRRFTHYPFMALLASTSLPSIYFAFLQMRLERTLFVMFIATTLLCLAFGALNKKLSPRISRTFFIIAGVSSIGIIVQLIYASLVDKFNILAPSDWVAVIFACSSIALSLLALTLTYSWREKRVRYVNRDPEDWRKREPDTRFS